MPITQPKLLGIIFSVVSKPHTHTQNGSDPITSWKKFDY